MRELCEESVVKSIINASITMTGNNNVFCNLLSNTIINYLSCIDFITITTFNLTL